jgi:hypothetical protein
MNSIIDFAYDLRGNFLDHYVIEATFTFVILAVSVFIGLLIGFKMWRKRANSGKDKQLIKLRKALLPSFLFSLISTAIIAFFFVLKHKDKVEAVLEQRMAGIEKKPTKGLISNTIISQRGSRDRRTGVILRKSRGKSKKCAVVTGE